MIQSSKLKLRQILGSQNYDVIKMNARDSDRLTPFNEYLYEWSNRCCRFFEF